MVILQGDIYWVDLGTPIGSAPGYHHPHVVIQNNLFNQTRLNTVLMCAMTSNLKRAEAPGNLLLNLNEGGLPKRSVVLVSQIVTIDKSQLGDYVGTLSGKRVQQILTGIKLLTDPHEAE